MTFLKSALLSVALASAIAGTASAEAAADGAVSQLNSSEVFDGSWTFDLTKSRAELEKAFDKEIANIGVGVMSASSVVINVAKMKLTYMIGENQKVGDCDIKGFDDVSPVLENCFDTKGEPADPIEFGIPVMTESGMALRGSKGSFLHYTRAAAAAE